MLTKSHHIISIIIFLMVCSLFGLDMYSPSLPAMTHALNTNHTQIEMSMALYLLGFSFPQLFYGPWSDRIGRKKVLLIGIMFAAIGALICANAISIHMLLTGRFIQGIGGAAIATLSRTIFRDLYEGSKLAQAASYLSTAMSLAPLIAPTIGGYVQHTLNWRGNFWILLALYLLGLLLVLLYVPETNRHLNPKATHLRHMIKNYWTLLTHKTLIYYGLCSALAFSGVTAYIVMNPFIFQNELGLSAIQNGWISSLSGCALIAGSILNILLVRRLKNNNIILAGLSIMTLGGFTMLLVGTVISINVLIIVLPMMIYIMGTKMIYSNAMVGALEEFKNMGGSAVALYSSIQMLTTTLTNSIVSRIHPHNQLPLAIILLVFGITGIAILYFKIMSTAPTKPYAISQQ